jgi:hypothetical protein
MDDDVTGVTQHNLVELRQRYERYLVAGLPPEELQAVVDQDRIDSEQIECQIEQHVSRLPDFEYFCGECREKLNNWPMPSAQTFGTCLRTFDTIALEAAARRGCRFCCLILRTLVDENMLQISRRIEARLTLLGKCGKSKVMKFELEDARIILRISLPARAIDWHFFLERRNHPNVSKF